MKNFDKRQFFTELGLENLPESKKDEVWAKFTELVSLEVLDKILDQLPQKEQNLLFLNLAKKPAKVKKFLLANPDFGQITTQAIFKIKKQIAKKF